MLSYQRLDVYRCAIEFVAARGSAMESGAILDVSAAVGVADSAAAREASELLVRIVEMLTKMTPVA